MNSKLISILALILALVAIGLGVYANLQVSKIRYVDTIELVKEFALTKELEAEDAPVLQQYKLKLDSLGAALKVAKTESMGRELQMVFYRLEQEYKNIHEQSSSRINQMAWNRLNKFIDDYGKEKGYELLLGANGMGTILYSSSSRNETESLIKYCNSKYRNE